jgi:Family of unknown function (DUF5723)
MMLSFLASKAQGDITLYSMRELNQSTYSNPAFISTYNQSIGFPVLSNLGFAFQLSGFNLGNVLSNIASDGYFHFTDFSHDINSGIGIKLNLQTDFFHYSKQFGKYQIGLNVSLRSTNDVYFSKEFIGFITGGNAPYEGQTISLSGTRMNISTYTETGLSIAREFKKFTIGARVKMLNGIANVSSDNVNLDYHTAINSFDQTTVSLSGNVNSSGLPDIIHQDTINGKVNGDTSFSPSDIKPFNNLGWAFDFGATYNVTPRLKFSASAIDIGFINWKNRTYNYDVNNVILNFPGLSTVQLRDSAAQTQYTDSLKGLVKTGTTKNNYTTILPSRFMVSADYDISLRDRVGFLFQMQYFLNTFYPSYSINYSRKIGTNWRITTNYSYYNNSFTNIGLGTSIKIGAFQVYLIQDDILFYFIPSTTRTIYIRFGCNLVWGENKMRVRF